MDIRFAMAPNSQQLNNDDFLVSDATYTVKDVTVGTDDQKLFIHLVEVPGRTYRPGKTMTRLLGLAWGEESDNWIGRRIRFYRDASVKYGKEETGGIRINGLSHINKPVSKTQTAGAGKGKTYIAEPLPNVDPAIQAHIDAIQQAVTLDNLRAAFFAAPVAVQKTPHFIAVKDKRKSELTPAPEQEVQG